MGRDQVIAEFHSEENWRCEEIWQASRTDPAQLAAQTQQLWDQSGCMATQWAGLVATNAALQAASQGVKGRHQHTPLKTR